MGIVIRASRMKYFLATLFLLVGELKPQNNPICKAKRYQCQTGELPEGACVQLKDEQEKYYYIRACKGEKSYCPYEKAVFGTPAKCEAPSTQTAEPALPYDSCKKDSDCVSQFCDKGRCIGKLANEACKSHADCGVDLYCNKFGVCARQEEFDQPCTEDYMCVNNCLCNNNKCAFYYTFAIGTEATNPQACESGYIENGKCQAGLRTKNPGQPCSTDKDCMFIDSEGKVKKYGNCTCGFNAGTTLSNLRFLLLLQPRNWRPGIQGHDEVSAVLDGHELRLPYAPKVRAL